MSTSAVLLVDRLTATGSVGLLIKVTILLLAAGLVSVLLRRKSAAIRHFVWALALGAAVALAFLSPVAPVLPVPVSTPIASQGTPNVLALPSGIWNDRGEERPALQPRVTVTGNAALPPRTTTASFTVLLLIAWGAGVTALLTWALFGQLGLARLARTADLVRDPAWQALLASARVSLGVTREVRLCRSSAVGAPLTWGFLRPIIMLPLDTDAWSEERRHVVLLHELAHVARRDYVMQLLASVSCAMYWFHPGVWMAARRLRNESERACDDQVLALGTSAADYAAHLLSVATGARALRLGGAVAIGMARRSALEGRLLAALDQSTARTPLSARMRAVSTGALGIALLPLAGVRAVDRVESLPAVVVASSDALADSTFEHVLPASAGERLTLHLGPGGNVDIRGWDEARVRVRVVLRGDNWRDMVVEAQRDADGVVIRSRYEIQRRTQSSNARFEISVPRRYDVQLSSGGGALTVAGVQGSFRGHTGGGTITLERVSGSARLSTGGGDVTVSDVDLSGSVSTGGGLVMLSRVSGGLRGYSGSGPVIYAESPNARTTTGATADLQRVEVDKKRDRISMVGSDAGTIHITKAGGDVHLDAAPRGAIVHTGGGRVRVGASAGFVDASTGGGDVTIGPVAGSVRAGTGAGVIEVTVVDAGGAEQTVEITAGVGRVTLVLPESFDGRFELETAYSRRFGRATRIESPWNLERETTTEWDDREGTPRRYVRASGTVGRGRGLVSIKTMNGDIEVRRGR